MSTDLDFPLEELLGEPSPSPACPALVLVELPDAAMSAFRLGGAEALLFLLAHGSLGPGPFRCPECQGDGCVDAPPTFGYGPPDPPEQCMCCGGLGRLE